VVQHAPQSYVVNTDPVQIMNNFVSPKVWKGSVFVLLFLQLRAFSACNIRSTDVETLDETTALNQVDTIQVKETNGQFVGDFGSIDVTLDPFRLYIADLEMHRVAVVHGETGQIVNIFGEAGQGPGEFEQPSRVIRMDSLLFVEDRRSIISVFDQDGEFLYRNRLPEGVWAAGRWSLTHHEGALYLGIGTVDPRSEGLIRSPDEPVGGKLVPRGNSIKLTHTFGEPPSLYQEEEYAPQTITIDVNDVDKKQYAISGYNYSKEIKVHNIEKDNIPVVDTMSLSHPKFKQPNRPMPMELSRPEREDRFLEASTVVQTFLFGNGTLIHVFENFGEGYFEEDRAYEKRHQYATLGHIDSETRKYLELPGLCPENCVTDPAG